MIRTFLALMPADRRGAMGLHLALTVVSVILRALGTVVLVPLVAALFGPEPAEAWPWLGLLALATAAGWAIDAVISRIGMDLGFALLDSAQHGVTDRLSRIRLSWFTPANTATARQAIAATGPDLVGIVVYLLTPLLSGILLPITIAIALIPISGPLALAALIGVPILLAAFFGGARIGRHADRVAAETNSALTERVVEFARTQQALRASRRTETERSLVGTALSRQHGAAIRVLLLQVPGQVLFGIASQLALLVLAGTTAYLTVTGTISVPEAIALIVVIIRCLEPFTSLAGLSAAIESTTGVLRNIRTVLDAPTVGTAAPTDSTDRAPAQIQPHPQAQLHAQDLPRTQGQSRAQGSAASAPAITLTEVAFRYDPDSPDVVAGLDLEFAPGTTTAIVGPSGSGKSTILSLIAGLQEPSAGRVLVDGVDLAVLDATARHTLTGVVFQHPYLFDGSLRANVLAGHPEATEQRIDDVARLARLDELLARIPGGWDAEVGEGGTALSGGERQRVSIARALLKPAPILLVDEATSALDTENETAIVTALTDDPTPRTRILVAHRLGSIRTADRVIFLAEGRVIEDGTIDELRAADGRFAHFWREQDAASGWKLRAHPSA
ncbi:MULTISPECIES: ABC transporter ATP-binding protein [unclassified Brevibacterium]|uniref:ABC transporter ATP-binding protein n=1 Tax=unclassified Brevibacterium TaxID=2614124 RepID=UPI0010919DF1|nr:ABC transporter ATP-binding protein [Brevibacterium sp. S22]TGD32742.1 ABC transporter ATP-binding protein [Brevibacterium sp. S22]